MGLKTRLDKNTDGNNRLNIVNEQGELVAIISAVSSKVEIEIATAPGLHIEKPNGYSSKR